MTNFNWTCPFCDRDSTVTDSNYHFNTFAFYKNNKYGRQEFEIEITVCPNEKCKEYAIRAEIHNLHYAKDGKFLKKTKHHHWKLHPQSSAKPFPAYIPKQILDDYKEACLIRDLSPKASATLARRCLQGMIRDFWSVQKAKLSQEINGIKDKVDPTTWKAIDS